MRSAAAGVCVPRLANGFLTRPQPARFRSTGYAMGSKSGNRIYAPGSRAFLKQWKHSRIDRRISCRQDFPSHISSSATALSDSLRRGSFCSGRIVRQTRVEFRPSNPEGSRGFESLPLRHPVFDFHVLCGKIGNMAHVRGLCSTKGHRRSSDSAVSSQLMLDSLCREPDRCPPHHRLPKKAFAWTSPFQQTLSVQ